MDNQRTFDPRTVRPGLYRVWWVDDGNANETNSLAAVGIGREGKRWLAPINWTRPSTLLWRLVDRLEPVLLEAPTSSQFAAGDVVRLKCGGPKMVIEWLRETEANVCWHNDSGEAQAMIFVLDALVKQEPEKR
jgi:uncharacterized protein YodC (DUF2158 family)